MKSLPSKYILITFQLLLSFSAMGTKPQGVLRHKKLAEQKAKLDKKDISKEDISTLSKIVGNKSIVVKAGKGIQLLDGFNLSLKARVTSEPSYNGGFIKKESYSITPSFRAVELLENLFNLVSPVDLRDLLGGANIPYFYNIIPTRSISVYRLAKTRDETFKKFSLKSLPLSAEKFDELDEGTFVSMPVGYKRSQGLSPSINIDYLKIGISLARSITANYNINIAKVRMNGKIYARVIAFIQKSSSKPKTLIPNINLSLNLKEIFSNNLVARVLKKASPRLVYRDIEQKGTVDFYDYYIDMTSEEGRSAYNQIMNLNPDLSFKQAIGMIIEDKDEYRERIRVSFDHARYLAKRDREESEKYRAVIETMSGLNIFNEEVEQFRYNLLLRSRKYYSSHSNNYYRFTDKNFNERHLFSAVDTESTNKYWNCLLVFFKCYRKDVENKIYLISHASERGLPLASGLSSIGITYEISAEKIKPSIIKTNVRKRVRSLIPQAVFKNIPWVEFKDKEIHRRAKIYFNLNLTEQGLRLMHGSDNSQVSLQLSQILKNKLGLKTEQKCTKDKLCNRLLYLIQPVLFPSLTNKEALEKINSFMTLVKDDKTKLIAIESLFSLVKARAKSLQASMKDIVAVYIRWASDKVESKSFTSNYNSSSIDLFRSMEFIADIIKDGSTDNTRLLFTEPYLEDEPAKVN